MEKKIASAEAICGRESGLIYDPLDFLSEESWVKVDAHIRKAQRALLNGQKCKKQVGITNEDFRKILCGIYYRMTSDCKWQEVPSKYGDYTVIYAYFRYWLRDGLIEKVNRLRCKEQSRKIKDAIEQICSHTPPEPSDFQKAGGAIDGLGYWLKQHTEKLHLTFDFLTDDEQLSLIASLESEINSFTTLAKRLETSSSESATQLLKEQQQRPYGWPEGAKNHSDFKEAQNVVHNIAFHINHYFDKIVTVFDNLTDDEKLAVSAGLAGELERLRTLLAEIKEIELMNKDCQILLYG